MTHDLSTVEYLCDRLVVMYLGRALETGTRNQVFSQPTRPYTQSLLSAARVPDPAVQRSRARIALEGELPSPADVEETPELLDRRGDGHLVACHLVADDGEPPRVAGSATTA